MTTKAVGFNVRALFALKADRLYRVYATPEGLYLIRIGGQGGLDAANLILGAGGGALGGLLASALGLNKGAGPDKKAVSADEQGPQALMGHHKHDQLLRLEDIVESSIEPPASLPGHGPQAARWALVTGERKWDLQFETNEDVMVALEHLPPVLGERLRVNIEWSPTKGKYVRKSSAARRPGG